MKLYEDEKIYDKEMIEILKDLIYVESDLEFKTLTTIINNFKIIIYQRENFDKLRVYIENLHTSNFEQGYISKKDLNFDKLSKYTLENYFKKVFNDKKSHFENLKESLKNDSGYLLSWHCNVAMFIHDFCLIQDYKERNKIAHKFMKKIFDVNYNWEKLTSSNGSEC